MNFLFFIFLPLIFYPLPIHISIFSGQLVYWFFLYLSHSHYLIFSLRNLSRNFILKICRLCCNHSFLSVISHISIFDSFNIIICLNLLAVFLHSIFFLHTLYQDSSQISNPNHISFVCPTLLLKEIFLL